MTKKAIELHINLSLGGLLSYDSPSEIANELAAAVQVMYPNLEVVLHEYEPVEVDYEEDFDYVY